MSLATWGRPSKSGANKRVAAGTNTMRMNAMSAIKIRKAGTDVV